MSDELRDAEANGLKVNEETFTPIPENYSPKMMTAEKGPEPSDVATCTVEDLAKEAEATKKSNGVIIDGQEFVRETEHPKNPKPDNEIHKDPEEMMKTLQEASEKLPNGEFAGENGNPVPEAAKPEIVLSEPPAPETPVDEEGNPLLILDPTKVNLKDLSTEEIMGLYKLSIDVKNDPKLNPVPLLPESIRNYIISDAKAMGFSPQQVIFLAREMVLAFGNEISMDKEIQDLQNEITRVMNIPEFMDFYGDALRENYEVKLKEKAEQETDPEKKASMLLVSKAFTDSYTLEPLMAMFDDAGFIGKIVKLLRKKANKLCDDFDYVLNKIIVKRVSVRSTVTSLKLLYPEMEPWRRELLVLFLIYRCRFANKDDKYMMMYMYSSIFNINSLASAEKTDLEKENVEFSVKRRGYLDAFFEKTREIFPASDFPEQKNVKKKEKKGRRTSK